VVGADGDELDDPEVVEGVDDDEPLVAAFAATAPPTSKPADTTPAATILCTGRMSITSSRSWVGRARGAWARRLRAA
jgi:hypothetical protein